MTSKSILVTKQSFIGELDGTQLEFREGDLIEGDHPAVKAWPEMFDAPLLRFPVKHASKRVEQATAAPGEKRKR